MTDNATNQRDPVPSGDLGIPLARAVGENRPLASPEARAPDLGPMYLTGATRGSVWLDLGTFVVAIILFDLALGTILGFFASPDQPMDRRVLQVVALPFRGVGWVAILMLLVRRRGQRAASVGLIRRRLAVDLALGLAALAGAFAAFYLGAVALLLFWPEGWLALSQNKEAVANMLPRMHPILLVALQFVVAVYEEAVFRGFLLTRLRRGLGGSWVAATVISSALFAVAHTVDQEMAAAVPIFGLGVAFCIFTIWRKSLVPGIIGHALFNSCQLLYLYYYYPDWT
jgi:membrane protease YdiL (CAAX protease family)